MLQARFNLYNHLEPCHCESWVAFNSSGPLDHFEQNYTHTTHTTHMRMRTHNNHERKLTSLGPFFLGIENVENELEMHSSLLQFRPWS